MDDHLFDESFENQKPKSTLLDNFWDGVLTGEFPGVNEGEIHAILQDKLLIGQPLTPLSHDEEETLHKALLDHYKNVLNRGYEVGLCGNPVYYITPGAKNEKIMKRHSLFRHLETTPAFIVLGAAEIVAKHGGYNPLSVGDKIRLYSDPEVWEFSDIISDTSHGNIVGNGSRLFFETDSTQGSYGFTHGEFASIIKVVSQSVGHSQLHVCDLGGNTGRACHEIQSYYPGFAFTNITIDEEPAMWQGINHVVVPAERIPERYRETFDIVISNMAWRYFVYPDKAMQNALQALTVGGYAQISFFYHSSQLEKEAEERTRQTLAMLSTLKAEQKIDYVFQPTHEGSLEGELKIEKKDSIIF